MGTPLTIIVPGVPVAKGRPRFTRSGRSYTPSKTRSYEDLVVMEAKLTMMGSAPLDGALNVCVCVHLPIPRGWSRKKTAAAKLGEVLPTARPDIDNFIKAALDGLNGVAFRDDSQVVCLSARKTYSASPRLEITIEPAKGEIA